MPIYQTSTFVQPNIDEFGAYDYTRSGNPTRTAVEILVAKLEGAHSAFAFSTGMAALSCLMSTLSHGDHIIAMSDLYGGMHRLMTQVTHKFGISVSFVDMSNVCPQNELQETSSPLHCSSASPSLPTLKQVILSVYHRGKSKLIHVESPSNPLMKITNLRHLAEIAHELGMLVSVDNTMMTPVRCQPLQLNCDVVMHSGTKFFAGHSDTMCGFLACKDPAMSKKLAFLQNAEGTALAPFDCWLVLRGMKTLCLRVERQEVNAIAVALFLCRQSHFVRRLHFAGVDPRQYQHIASISLPHFLLHHSQTSGPGSVLSFETGSVEESKKFVNACRIFKLTVSFGSCNSLVEMPCLLSHASIPKEKRTLPENLVRLAVGIEHVQDLINDLSQAIAAATVNACAAAA
jgi:cystathionine beta-lyase